MSARVTVDSDPALNVETGSPGLASFSQGGHLGSLSPARISGHCHRTSLSRVAGRGSPEPKCQPKSCLGIAEISPDRALSRVLVTVSRLRSGHCGRRLAAGAGTRLDPTHGHPTRSQPLV